MRLAQLAREVQEKTFTIREALSDKFDINFEKGPNTKMEQEHIDFVYENFKKEEPVVLEPIVEKMVPVGVASVTEKKAQEEEAEVVQPEEPIAETAVEAEEEKIEESPEIETPVEVVAEEIEENQEEDLSKKTVADLKAIAKEKGITGISKMKKADLISAIEGNSGPEAPKEETKPEKVDLVAIKKKSGVTTVEDFLGRPEPEFPDLPKPEEAELIKAPKIELEGIKVVDKIDLPEPPKPKEKDEDTSEVKKERTQNRKKSNQNRDKKRHDNNRSQDSKPKKKKDNVNRGPSKQEMQKRKMEESYKPKPKQVKGKKKKAAKKKTAPQKAPEVQPEPVQNPKKGLAKFWWWLTNG